MKAMGLILQEIYRRVDLERVNICYMVDASDVMIGNRIGTVNSSVEECTPMYKEIEKETGVTCYFRVMKYSTGASWVNSEWQSSDDLIFNDIQASGECEYGAALNLLGSELERRKNDNAYWIILNIACGTPTDNWKPIMRKLKQLNQFRQSLRIVMNIESQFPVDIAEQFTGNIENVLLAKETRKMNELIVDGIYHYFGE